MEIVEVGFGERAGPVLQAGGAAAQVGGAIWSAFGAPEFGGPIAAVGKVAATARARLRAQTLGKNSGRSSCRGP